MWQRYFRLFANYFLVHQKFCEALFYIFQIVSRAFKRSAHRGVNVRKRRFRCSESKLATKPRTLTWWDGIPAATSVRWRDRIPANRLFRSATITRTRNRSFPCLPSTRTVTRRENQSGNFACKLLFLFYMLLWKRKWKRLASSVFS